MDKKWIIAIVITVVVGLMIGIGFAIFSGNNETENIDYVSEKELADTNKYENSFNYLKNENIIETSSIEDTISPNAIIIKKTYFEACDHLIRKTEDVPEELVNKNEEDVEKQFSEWKIEEYTPTQIILYKTDSGNCGEHYFVQEHNGVIGIYTIDEYGIKTLKEDTEISTQYLPEEDVKNLKAGVEIVGNTNLVEFLEDYE